jgi:hypothetical protein
MRVGELKRNEEMKHGEDWETENNIFGATFRLLVSSVARGSIHLFVPVFESIIIKSH